MYVCRNVCAHIDRQRHRDADTDRGTNTDKNTGTDTDTDRGTVRYTLLSARISPGPQGRHRAKKDERRVETSSKSLELSSSDKWIEMWGTPTRHCLT